MRKFFFYPMWNMEKAEAYLSEMEAKGFRLERVKLLYFFQFRKAAPKEAQYVLSYRFVKAYDILEYEYELRRDHSAQIVQQEKPWGTVGIHRIVGSAADLRHFRACRRQYMRRVLLQRLLFWLFLMACAIVARQASPVPLVWVCMGISAGFVLVNVVGLLHNLFDGR